MSEKVLNPFEKNKDRFAVSSITEGVGVVKDVIGMFKEEITPEKQQEKAGVWYNMLKTYVTENISGVELGKLYYNSLPFKQKKTKDNFIKSQLTNKPKSSIINHLVKKINDELLKGGLGTVTKDQILSGMGVDKKSTGLKAIFTKPETKGYTPSKLPVNDINKPELIDPKFNVVLPLRATMSDALKTRGVIPAKNIEVLTNQFYNEIVRVDQPNNFTGQIQLPSVNLYDYVDGNSDIAKDAIITAVMVYIKGLKARENEGGELTRVQKIIVDGANKAENAVRGIAKKETAQNLGNKILFEGYIWYVLGGVFLLIVGVVALRKN